MNNVQERITLYGTYWCPDCRRSKQFLGENQIPYEWVNIEMDKDAENYVRISTVATMPGIMGSGLFQR